MGTSPNAIVSRGSVHFSIIDLKGVRRCNGSPVAISVVGIMPGEICGPEPVEIDGFGAGLLDLSQCRLAY
jgi:hypothetical protein